MSGVPERVICRLPAPPYCRVCGAARERPRPKCLPARRPRLVCWRWVAPGRGTFMDLDAKVCYCFHITRRKLVNFTRLNRPRVPSQLSECGGAGTGCGWCIPFLKQIHRELTGGEAGDLER